jgi:hypothetical protein
VSEKDVDLQQTTQTFVRFLLSQLNKELLEIESSRGIKPAATVNVVDKVFGFHVQSCTTFLHSGVVEMSATSIQSLTLDLIYPAATQTKSQGKQSKYFIIMRLSITVFVTLF